MLNHKNDYQKFKTSPSVIYLVNKLSAKKSPKEIVNYCEKVNLKENVSKSINRRLIWNKPYVIEHAIFQSALKTLMSKYLCIHAVILLSFGYRYSHSLITKCLDNGIATE